MHIVGRGCVRKWAFFSLFPLFNTGNRVKKRGYTARTSHTLFESFARNTSVRWPSVCAWTHTLYLRYSARRDVLRIKKLTSARNSRARLKGSAKLITHTTHITWHIREGPTNQRTRPNGTNLDRRPSGRRAGEWIIHHFGPGLFGKQPDFSGSLTDLTWAMSTVNSSNKQGETYYKSCSVFQKVATRSSTILAGHGRSLGPSQ